VNKKIEFKPIKGFISAHIALSIYPPRTRFNNEQFSVFVGGGGVGERATLKAARDYLHAMAIRECDRAIEEAQKKIEHYKRERDRLICGGLEQ